jgi:hypothetical protein
MNTQDELDEAFEELDKGRIIKSHMIAQSRGNILLEENV